MLSYLYRLFRFYTLQDWLSLACFGTDTQLFLSYYTLPYLLPLPN